MAAAIPTDSPPSPSRPSAEPDAHGQAALLLAESILHALVETTVFDTADAVAVVRSAADVKREVATLAGESEGRMMESLALLARIQISFESDENARPKVSLVPDPDS